MAEDMIVMIGEMTETGIGTIDTGMIGDMMIGDMILDTILGIEEVELMTPEGVSIYCGSLVFLLSETN